MISNNYRRYLSSDADVTILRLFPSVSFKFDITLSTNSKQYYTRFIKQLLKNLKTNQTYGAMYGPPLGSGPSMGTASGPLIATRRFHFPNLVFSIKVRHVNFQNKKSAQ
jgi:hypothetical protein